MIKVYGSKNCIQCVSTTVYLDKHGIEFEYLDVHTVDPEELRGHKTLPICINGDDSWSGFNPNKIKDAK